MNANPLSKFEPPPGAPAGLVAMQRRFLASQAAEQSAKIAAIERQIAQKEAERATIKASIDKLRATIVPLQERVEIRKTLFNRELGSKLLYLSELQDLVSQRQEINVQQSRYNEADAAIASLIETRNKTAAEYERGLFDDLNKAEQKAAELAQDVIKAQERTKLQNLTAPVDGLGDEHVEGEIRQPIRAEEAQPLLRRRIL